jgi:hypothetical protein
MDVVKRGEHAQGWNFNFSAGKGCELCLGTMKNCRISVDDFASVKAPEFIRDQP